MDQATLSALMKSYGAADTPENSNRIRSFYGANPDQAERRLMGMTGTSGQEGAGGRDDVLNAMLDKVIAQTSGPVQGPMNEVSSGMDYSGAPAKRGAASAPRVQNDNRGISSPYTGDPLRDAVNDYTPSNPNAMPPARNDDGGLWPLLIGTLLGTGVASLPGRMKMPDANSVRTGVPANVELPEASYVGRMARGDMTTTGANQPRGQGRVAGPANQGRVPYEPKLENQGPTEVRNSPELEAKGKASTDNYAKLQAEVDAENAAANRNNADIMEQMKAQARTRDLMKKARLATGRK